MARRATPRALDFRLLVTPHVHETRQVPTTLVVLETSQPFASFTYELSVEEHREKGILRYRVLGLKAPQMSLPRPGPARFVREYEDLRGTVTFHVEGLDGEIMSCTVALARGRAHVIAPPKSRRLTVITDATDWEKF